MFLAVCPGLGLDQAGCPELPDGVKVQRDGSERRFVVGDIRDGQAVEPCMVGRAQQQHPAEFLTAHQAIAIARHRTAVAVTGVWCNQDTNRSRHSCGAAFTVQQLVHVSAQQCLVAGIPGAGHRSGPDGSGLPGRQERLQQQSANNEDYVFQHHRQTPAIISLHRAAAVSG
jgi:hypothetical protein